MKKMLGVVLLLCAYGLLYPGLTETMLNVSGTVEKSKLVELGKDLIQESPNTPALVNNLVDMVVESLDVDGTVNAFDKTRSILGTAQELYSNGHRPVAFLIVLFSAVIPFFKALILLGLFLPISRRTHELLIGLSNAVSKWSMADVFVVAIFIAFLASNGIRESRGLVDFDATLGSGFWYFLAYCLLSILATQLLTSSFKAAPPEPLSDVATAALTDAVTATRESVSTRGNSPAQ